MIGKRFRSLPFIFANDNYTLRFSPDYSAIYHYRRLPQPHIRTCGRQVLRQIKTLAHPIATNFRHSHCFFDFFIFVSLLKESFISVLQ